MNKVLIKHFNGLESEWNIKILSGLYANSIVFAKIWTDETNPPSVKTRLIYAGKDINGEEYQFPVGGDVDLEKIEKEIAELKTKVSDLQSDVAALLLLVKIGENGKFTSDVMTKAVQEVVNDMYYGDERKATDTNAMADIKRFVKWTEET